MDRAWRVLELFYLAASQGPLLPFAEPQPLPLSLAAFLESSPDAALRVPPQWLEQYTGALRIVDPADPNAVASCFTAAYGRSPVRSGSYLKTPEGARRFSPLEVLRLLGFPEWYELPPGLSCQQAWALAGNSLSVAAVRHVLSAIPELAGEEMRASNGRLGGAAKLRL